MKAITQTRLWEMYIDSARHAFENGQPETAEEILTNAMKELTEIVETRKLLLIEAQRALANIYRSEKRFAEADPLYKWALAMAEANFGRVSPYLLPLLEDMAASYKMQERTEDERRLHDRISEIEQATASESKNPPEFSIQDTKAKAS